MTAVTHEGLYRAHQTWLHSWLRGRLGAATDRAPDFVQETFLRLLQAGQVPPELAQPRPYLATIARGLLIDHFRRQDLERAYLAELALVPEACLPSPEDRAIVMETLLAIDRMLDGLGPKVKHAFLLAQLDGLGYAEIAAELGVSVSSVKKYMHKAVLHCLQCLEP